MSKEKETFYFPIAIVLIFLTAVITGFVQYGFSFGAFGVFLISVIVCGSLAGIDSNIRGEISSFKNPLEISAQDAGRIVRIKKIKDDKIGLVDYGYSSEYGARDTSTALWYKSSCFPKNLQNIGMVLKIESTKNDLVFKKVQVNGWIASVKFETKDKEPLEVLDEEFTVN